ncbi:hypothetical protein GCM10017083_38920 [Thalassobaculum fulvum]|uniref:histidine kinase n=1 Tax=Thalassobaculum fulvum TaxID=1633335 RepID=A0A918XUL5_9PROT|nr:PAS-domain containing protein [Thalassobaculum fulvum]GHD57429.1 hypothetical protein GCM10017083_38920 [Thalassobaculum fulvum]
MAVSTGCDAIAPAGIEERSLVDCLDEAVVAVDSAGRIVVWNPAAARLFGIPGPTAMGASRTLIEPAEEPEGWSAEVLQGRPRRFRATRVDGHRRPLLVDVTASPLVGPDGGIAGLVQILRPVPQLGRRMLIQLAEDMARIGHWRIEPDTGRQIWSDEVYRIHGLAPRSSAPTPQSALELYHPDDRERVTAAISEAVRRGVDLAFEARVVRPDGELRRVVCRGTTERGADGRVTAVVGVLQDVTDQVSREQALAERERSSRILREAIDAVQDSISVYDEQDRFVVANRKFFELYPYLENEANLRGKTFEDVLRISLRNRVHMDHWSLADPEGYVQERLRDRQEGRQMPERRLWNGRWYIIRENRTPSGYTISTRIDITDRKSAEIELAATSAFLQTTLDTMPNALIAFDSENRLVAWNRAYAEMVRLDPELLARGRPLRGVAKDVLRSMPSTESGIRPMFRHIARHEAADFEWLREDGSVFAVLGRTMSDGGYMTLFRDVTAERQAQARAAEFEQRLSDALEAMSEGFALFDADDVLVLCNETYRSIYGESSTFIRVGRRFEDMVRDSVAAGQFPAAIGREEEWIAERLRAHRNPPEQPALQTLSDGRVLMVAEYRTKEGGCVGIRADITERVRTEHDLRAARDALEEQARSLRDLAGQIDAARRRAEEAGAAKSRFLAMMSHELRTPMTGLLGMIELISRTPLDAEQRAFVSTMRESAETLLALLNDILDYSKLEAGKVQIEEIAFDPAQVMRDVVGLFQAQASAKGLVLAGEVRPTVPSWVRGDPLRVKQILSNLVSNAIKFTAAGNIVMELSAAEGPNGTIRLQGRVSDTGQGIDPDIQQNLFQAFEQGDTSTTRRFGGTGLGLAISRRLVEGMGGEITVESEPGKGATFRFSVLVSIAAVPPAGGPEADDADDGPLPPLRVLLAEDNDVNRMLVSKVLAQSGHRVDEVSDGREALRAAVRVDYDVILMDMQMPVMDGMEATRAIRTLPDEAADVPIVALTADAMPEHRQMYLDAGVDALLTKPVDWRMLNRTLARVVRGERTAVAEVSRPSPVPAPPEATLEVLPVFDRARVEDGLGVLPPQRVASMLAMLPSEIERRLGEYRSALEAEDLPTARRAAHTLKGLAANFGAARLEAVSRAAEAACGSLGSARAAVPLIEEAVRATAVVAGELSVAFGDRAAPGDPSGGQGTI